MEVKEIVSFLRKKELSVEERNLITGVLLDSLGAVPLRDILYADDTLVVDGTPIDDLQAARNLRESADAALTNRALSLIREQVKYESFNAAARTAADAKDLLFYRAALWWGEQVEKKLRFLAQQNPEPVE